MPFKTNWEKLSIIIIFLIIIINFIFRTDMLALITRPIALIIVMILCQTSVIAEKRSNINQLTPSPNVEECKGNGLNWKERKSFPPCGGFNYSWNVPKVRSRM